MSKAVERGVRRALKDLESYSRHVVKQPLRPYQLEAGAAIIEAVRARDARTVTVQMSRQAGKNEVSAHVEGYLMTLLATQGGSIVKASPTFRPQATTSMERLKRILANPLAEVRETEQKYGYVVSRGKAEAYFFSAEPDSHIVGATASVLLEVDEAQDVDVDKHDRDLAPMCASTAAARVYYGTGGLDGDLLQRMVAFNLEQQAKDGIRRHFEYPWWVVAEQVPDYAVYVESERARLGPNHPFFLSQYELKPVAAVNSLFSTDGLRSLQGHHPRLRGPRPGYRYVAGVDVAGAVEREWSEGDDGDSTVVTVAEVVEEREQWDVEEEVEEDEEREGAEQRWQERRALGKVARVVEIVELRGRSHLSQHRELLELLLRRWDCQRVAVDATGAGVGPCEMLSRAMWDRVVPFLFTPGSKSTLGFELTAAVDSGRLKMWAAGADDRESNAFWAQARAAKRTVREGGQISWGEKSGHDDYVAWLALCLYAVDSLPAPYVPGVTIRAKLPYEDDKDF